MKQKTFKRRKSISPLLLILPLCGLWFVGQGSYIHAKALLAQVLLETAWTDTLKGQKEVKPWPWADTWPVSRLSVPRLGLRRIVLAGVNGSALAFGPGHLFKSALPGEFGNTVIAGHRDTHFAFLKNIKPGDLVEMQTTNGNVFIYKVIETHITDEKNTGMMDKDAGALLTLITCYPFDAINPGGPLRYVVTAKRVGRYQQT